MPSTNSHECTNGNVLIREFVAHSRKVCAEINRLPASLRRQAFASQE
jgi:hypothetical protein